MLTIKNLHLKMKLWYSKNVMSLERQKTINGKEFLELIEPQCGFGLLVHDFKRWTPWGIGSFFITIYCGNQQTYFFQLFKESMPSVDIWNFTSMLGFIAAFFTLLLGDTGVKRINFLQKIALKAQKFSRLMLSVTYKSGLIMILMALGNFLGSLFICHTFKNFCLISLGLLVLLPATFLLNGIIWWIKNAVIDKECCAPIVEKFYNKAFSVKSLGYLTIAFSITVPLILDYFLKK